MPVEHIGFVPDAQVPLPDGRVLPLATIEQIDQSIRAQAASGDMRGSADILAPGAIVTPRYQDEILDIVRRRGVLGQRVKNVPATGQPSRYFEQRAIVEGQFTDPRAIAPTPGTPKRAERFVRLKAIVAQINFGLFDVELGRQQGQWAQLVAKDIEDAVQGVLKTSDKALWRGTDTDLINPTTNEYVGGVTQINRTFSVASSASAVDGIKAEVAAIMSQEDFGPRPTAIYVHPQTLDIIEQEERLNHRQMAQVGVTDRDGGVIAGLTVSALSTAAGLLPLIPDWTLPAPAASQFEQGKQDYSLAIVTEELVEYHYLTTAEPRLFVLGLQSNLATQYVCVMFGAPVFKGKADTATPEVNPVTYAHSIGYIVR